MTKPKPRLTISLAAVALVAAILLLWRIARRSSDAAPETAASASAIDTPGVDRATELSPAVDSARTGAVPAAVAPAVSNLGAPARTNEVTEAELMDQVRALVKTNPAQARRSIADANSHFGVNEERTALDIQALTGMSRIGAARREARSYFEEYPDGRSRAQIERLTGLHPHP